MKKKCKGGELGPPPGGAIIPRVRKIGILVIFSVNDVVILSAVLALTSITI